MASLIVTVGVVQIQMEDENASIRRLLKLSAPLLNQLVDQATVDEMLDEMTAREAVEAFMEDDD